MTNISQRLIDAIRLVPGVVEHLSNKAINFLLQNYGYKTQAAYERHLWSAVRDFYSGETDAFEFIDDFIGEIDNQFNRAWREGARDVGVEPKDFEDEDIAEIERLILAEREYILKLGEDIEKAAADGSPVTVFRSRVSIWANMYNDIANKSKLWFGGKTKLEWQLGATEEHCETCSKLNGIVAWAREWDEAGVKPQSPPNEDLECGGWRCDCSLVPTDKRRSRGAIDRILGIVGR